MNSPSAPITVDLVIENLAWTRALARRLIHDPGLAEDAVQDAWIAAASHGTEVRTSDLGWLARIVRNAVLAGRRSRGARAVRERKAAVPETVAGDPGELVVQAELGQTLGRAVLELEEPYRRTVLLRFWRGLGTREIARSEGIEVSTVRTRLQRALEHLRGRLASELGSEPDGWKSALALLAVPWGPRELGGFVLMKKLQLGASLLVLAIVGGTVWRGVAMTERTPATSEPQAANLAHEETATVRAIAIGTTDERSALVATGAKAPAAKLRGRVVTPTGLPISGARLAYFGAVPDHARDASVPGATSDAQGNFALALPPSPETLLRVEAAGHLTTRLVPEKLPQGPTTTFEIVLHPIGRLEVLVVDERDVPVAGVLVSARPHVAGQTVSWMRDVYRRARTGTDGRCEIADLPAGVPLSLSFPTGPVVGVHTIDPEHLVERVELVRATTGVVTGRVLDHRDAPAQGVIVVLSSMQFRVDETATDEAGRYRFSDVAPGPVHVRLRGKTPSSEADLAPASAEATGTLAFGATLELEPLRQTELALVRGRVSVPFGIGPNELGVEPWRDGAKLLSKPVWIDGEGRFELFVPAGPVLLLVKHHETFMMGNAGSGLWTIQSRRELGEVGRALVEAPDFDVAIVLDRTGAITGRLADDAPERVTLHFVEGEGPTEGLDPGTSLQLQADLAVEEGQFRSRALRPGTYHVVLEAYGHGTAWVGAVTVEPGRATDVGTLELKGAVGTLCGRVVTPTGTPVPQAIVTLSLPWNGGARGKHKSDLDGRFVIDALPLGLWHVAAARADLGAGSSVPVVVDGSTPREIDLVLASPAKLTVTVTSEGTPVRGQELSLGRLRGSRITLETFAVTDANGGASFEELAPGRVVVFAETLGGRTLTLEAGEERHVDLELGGAVQETTLTRNGSPLTELARVALIDVEPGSPTHGTRRNGTLFGLGRARLRPFPGRNLILAWVGPQTGAQALARLHEGSKLPDQLPLDGDALTLELGPRSAHASPPELELRGLAETDEPSPWILPIQLIREPAGPGTWLYPAVPRGLALVFVGRDANGDATNRPLAPDERGTVLRW